MDIKYRLYCDYCHYSRYTDGTDVQDLLMHNRSPVPTAIPKYDPKTKKTVVKTSLTLPKQFKCPGCGRLITPKKLKNENKTTRSETGDDGPRIS